MSNSLHLINYKNFIGVNKFILKQFGPSAALFLSQLVSMHCYADEQNAFASHPVYGDGWFYQKVEDIEDMLGIGEKEQRSVVRILKESGVIEMQVFDLPPRRYFRINIQIFNDIIENQRNTIDTSQTQLSKAPKRSYGNLPNAVIAPIYNRTNGIDKEPKGSIAPFSRDETDHVKPPNAQANAHAPNRSEIPSNPKIPDKPRRIIPKPESPRFDDWPDMAENVSVSVTEHQKLVEKFGADVTQECYEYLSDWKKSATPSQVNKHKSDYFRITKWVALRVREDKIKFNDLQKKEQMANIAPHRRGSKNVTRGDAVKDDFKWEKF
jgi:hypothetical protein